MQGLSKFRRPMSDEIWMSGDRGWSAGGPEGPCPHPPPPQLQKSAPNFWLNSPWMCTKCPHLTHLKGKLDKFSGGGRPDPPNWHCHYSKPSTQMRIVQADTRGKFALRTHRPPPQLWLRGSAPAGCQANFTLNVMCQMKKPLQRPMELDHNCIL